MWGHLWVLRDVIDREGPLTDRCPTSDRVRVIEKRDVTRRNTRCGCDNRDCWVYQYTDRDKPDPEHRGA